MEIEELIQKWIPHIKIISPLSLKKKIEEKLRLYLASIISSLHFGYPQGDTPTDINP